MMLDIVTLPIHVRVLYLVALMEGASRKVLSWRLSNTLDASFCVEILQEALEHYGAPKIFNTDQGSQFTSVDFTDVLKAPGYLTAWCGRSSRRRRGLSGGGKIAR